VGADSSASGGLLKRGDGLGLFIIRREEIQQAHHLQGLQGKFGRFEQTDGAAGLLGGGEMANQHADAAGVDIGDLFEIEDDFGVTLAEEFNDGGIEAIERRAHAEPSSKLDNFDAVHRFRINIQRRHPLAAGDSPVLAALTPQYGFVTVRGQLR
jgi:hypothetical protein